MFGKKKAPPRTCPEGHPQEESWEQCPFCAAERAAGATGPSESGVRDLSDPAPSGDPGRGAVVVKRKASAGRPLAGWVVALNGEQEGTDFRLKTGRNILGKGAKCDIVLRDAYVSERHAVLECPATEGAYVLEDLGSRHGTYLEDEPIEQGTGRRIPDGSRIRLGHTELFFRSFEGGARPGAGSD